MELNFTKRIFEYQYLDHYLKDYLIYQRRNKGKFTLKQFAAAVKLKDSSSINKVIKGQRNAGPELVDKLCDYFAFTSEQEKHFRNLARIHRYNQSNKKDREHSKYKGENIRSEVKAHSNHIRLLSTQESSRILHWSFFLIREMTKLKYVPTSITDIAAAIRFKLAKSEIANVLETLRELSLIEWKENQNLSAVSERFHTITDITNESLRHYHEGILHLALLSIRQIPTKERYLSASTIAVPDHAYEKAKLLIEKFQDEMAALCEETKGDQVYQLAVQFFPLTKLAKK